MGRPTRSLPPGETHHVVQRAANRDPCFLEPSDFALYSSLMAELARSCRVAIHAYVLMTNHVHLLVTPADATGISRLMQRLSQRYARAFNDRRSRSGTLWQGRFHASLVQTDAYVLACHRYIELNPVRAGIVPAPEHYRWSSHCANVGIDTCGFLTQHASLAALGKGQSAAIAAYRRLFDRNLDETTLSALRAGLPLVSDTCLTPGAQAAVNWSSASRA